MNEIQSYLDPLVRVLEDKGGGGQWQPEKSEAPKVGQVMTSEYIEKNPLEN